ncbi:Histidine kinase osmosensor, partial [Ceratobasidium sp. 395]
MLITFLEDLAWVCLMGGKIEVVSELGKGAMFRFFIRGTVPASSRGVQPPTPGFRMRRSASIHSKASGVSKASVRSGSRPLPETPNLHLSRPLHILITEDNKINQMKRAGFTFALASNGLEAINAIEKADKAATSSTTSGKYDVVLMDLEMPVMDGFAATREIRMLEADGKLSTRSFVIALTGNARREQVQAARDAGVDDVMIK